MLFFRGKNEEKARNCETREGEAHASKQLTICSHFATSLEKAPGNAYEMPVVTFCGSIPFRSPFRLGKKPWIILHDAPNGRGQCFGGRPALGV